MNELMLKEYTIEKVTYLYKPDGKGEWGEVAYIFTDDKAEILKQSKDDEIGRYGYKAARKIEECVKKNNLPLKFIQAWN